MAVVFSFIKLTYRYKVLALESLYLVILIRLMIWIYPFTVVQTKVQKMARRHDSDIEHVVPCNKLKIMILHSARYVPNSTCLVQALAGYILFSKYGYHPAIKIGVLTENGEFEAHAWLEEDDKVVLGESEKDFQTIMGIG